MCSAVLLFLLFLFGFRFCLGGLYSLFFTVQVRFPSFALNDLVILFAHKFISVVYTIRVVQYQTGGQAHLAGLGNGPFGMGAQCLPMWDSTRINS